MMQRIREFLESTAGKVVAVVLALIGVVVIYLSFRSNLGMSDAAAASRDRVFIDAKTGKTFTHEISVGETIPVKAPSGEKAGYLAEPCYWTKDGKSKSEPTWVLLNHYAGKKGPTFCPECDRLVIGMNPPPTKSDPPPPTSKEYASRPVEPREQ